MADTQRAIRIEGLAELRTAFRRAGNEMDKDLDAALKSSAEPVRTDAQAFTSSIRNMGAPKGEGISWQSMRVGITRHTVYVAPSNRGKKTGARKRRNLFDLLLSRSLEPALDANVSRAEQEVKDAIADMARAWERV